MDTQLSSRSETLLRQRHYLHTNAVGYSPATHPVSVTLALFTTPPDYTTITLTMSCECSTCQPDCVTWCICCHPATHPNIIVKQMYFYHFWQIYSQLSNFLVLATAEYSFFICKYEVVFAMTVEAMCKCVRVKRITWIGKLWILYLRCMYVSYIQLLQYV